VLTRRAALLSGAATVLAACGSSSGGKSVSDAATGDLKVVVTNATDLKDKPVLQVTPGTPPTTLQKTDLVVGTGKEATAADTVEVQYLGAHATNGKEFDSSWAHGGATSFPLGQVVPGFRDGISGMKVGGRSLLIMPPADGYGAAGSPPVIGPNETLIFVVDLIAIQ
jgi:peptidylprolyl isomerase